MRVLICYSPVTPVTPQPYEKGLNVTQHTITVNNVVDFIADTRLRVASSSNETGRKRLHYLVGCKSYLLHVKYHDQVGVDYLYTDTDSAVEAYNDIPI